MADSFVLNQVMKRKESKGTAGVLKVSDMALPSLDAQEAAGGLTGTPAASINGTDLLPLVLNQVSEPGDSVGEDWKNDATGFSWI
jgi:hypothetical protein